jgi:4-hydroxy-3-methylbut-2-enyl diphosphate reductase
MASVATQGSTVDSTILMKETRFVNGPASGAEVALRLRRVLVAAPRGYCAGVERAIETVREALEQRGAPLHVRRQIVHNEHVVHELEQAGAVFVSEVADVPERATVVFSAHGVSPAVERAARERGLSVIDATCPLVTKVHSEVRHYAARRFNVFLVGHAGHDEVEGTSGVAPDAVLLVETVADAERVQPPQTERLAYVTQTTLSVDETAAIVQVLRRRFPRIEAPRHEDICYATTNRQRAVKALLGEIDALLVVGSQNSSNSRRLVEVGEAGGVRSRLVSDESEIDPHWLEDVDTLGLTSGASVPESLVARVVDWLAARADIVVEERGRLLEDVSFNLPRELRRPETRPA